MNQPFFSVLIPVYNVEKYLAECLESVVTQCFQNFEVIIVIDGSTDNSLKIASRYADKDNRIKIIKSKNQGAFHSRSLAYANANGSHCICLDSDDKWKNNNVLSILYDTLKKCDADIVCFEKEIYFGDGKSKSCKPIFNETKFFEKENKFHLYKTLLQNSSLNSIWGKVFKTNLLDFSVFYSYPRVTMGEDLINTLYLFKMANKILYISDVLYEYRKNYSSISYSFGYSNKDAFFAPLRELNKCILENYYDNEEIKQLLAERYIKDMVVFSVYSYANINGKKEEYIKMLNDISEDDIFKDYFNQYNNKLNFKIKHPAQLLMNKKFKRLYKIKKILQNKLVNSLLRLLCV